MTSKPNPVSLSERVYLERIRQFFGHSFGNVLGGLGTVALLGVILHNTDLNPSALILWQAVIVVMLLTVSVIEFRVRRLSLTIHNARFWLLLRTVLGALVILAFGVTPLVFSASMTIIHDLYLLLLLVGLTTISSLSFVIMPTYTLVLSVCALLPITVHFLMRDYEQNLIFAISSMLLLLLVIAKAKLVSRAANRAIELNEQLRDEIDGHKQTRAQLHHMATHDLLTGLPNRQRLMSELTDRVAQAAREQGRVAVLFMDLDGFKAINDAHSHEAGDVTLQTIARRLEALNDDRDLAARFGGDEFVILHELGTGSAEPLQSLARRIIQTVAEPIDLPHDQQGQVTASIGIAIYPDDSTDVTDLIRHSDQAMYTVKKRGKNDFQGVG